jgi:hypothetical protein
MAERGRAIAQSSDFAGSNNGAIIDRISSSRTYQVIADGLPIALFFTCLAWRVHRPRQAGITRRPTTPAHHPSFTSGLSRNMRANLTQSSKPCGKIICYLDS